MSDASRTLDNETPRVWIGCLGCYNGGDLAGAWFDADIAPDEMSEWESDPQVKPGKYHRAEAHEELWVMDHENFHGLLKGECSPATARELADVLSRCCEPDAFAAYVDYQGHQYAAQNWDAALSDFEDAYCGEWGREEDYAEDLANELGVFNVPTGDWSGKCRDLSNGWPFTCINWEHAWNELRVSGDYYAVDVPGGGVYIYRSI